MAKFEGRHMSFLGVIVTWLYLCSLQWSVETTYTSPYSQPQPLISNFLPFQPFCPPDPSIQYTVGAYFDMNGIRGTVALHQPNRRGPVTVSVRLDGLDQLGEDERWGWHIHEYPVNFALLNEFPCDAAYVGGHYDPDDRISNENYTEDCSPTTRQACELGDLSGRFGSLHPNQSTYQFIDREFNLYGPRTFVGRSIVIHRTGGFRWACANIEYDGHNTLETFVATFPHDPFQQERSIQGDVVLRRSAKRAGISLCGVLYRVDTGPKSTTHKWNLREGTCENLKGVYGSYPRPYYDRLCSATRQRQCHIGDLTNKCGELESDEDGMIKFCCTDVQLGSFAWEPDNTLQHLPVLSLVIQEELDGEVLACSRFDPVQPKAAQARLEDRGEYVEYRPGRFRHKYKVVDLYFYQNDPHDPTYIRHWINDIDLKCGEFEEDRPYLQIRERAVGEDKNCSNLGPVFEPRFGFNNMPPRTGMIQTGDRDFLGELRYKIPLCNPPLRNLWLPLFGPYSIIGKSVVLHDGEGNALNCATIVDRIPNNDIRLSLAGY